MPTGQHIISESYLGVFLIIELTRLAYAFRISRLTPALQLFRGETVHMFHARKEEFIQLTLMNTACGRL